MMPMAAELERVPPGSTGRCECCAGDHGHPANACEYTARFILRPTSAADSVPIFMRVCSPCEAQWTRVKRGN